MKTKSRLRSCLALLLTMVMLFSVMTPMMSFTATALTVDVENVGANTKLTSKTDYAVAPGITESHIITHDKDGSNQIQAYALEIDLSNPNVGLIASYKNYMNDLAVAPEWGMQTVRDQAAAAENYHKNTLGKANFEVVGGINCDFFNMQTGEPMGSLVMNGKTYKSTSKSYFAILDDGSAVIGSGTVPSNAVEVVGGEVMLVQNGVVNPNIKGDQSKFPRTSIGLTADGKVILVTADGRQAPSSCGQTFEENAQQMLSLGCVTAMQVDGGGSATIVSQREGESSLSVRNSPSDGVERIVSTALLVYSNATPDGQFDHANLAPVNELYTPGSTVEFTATAVDGAGASAELPAEGYFALANEAAGTIDPATGVFTAAAGFTGEVTVNYMVGDAVKGSTTVSIVVPETLYVASAEQAVGPGITTDFGIVAKYQDRDVIMKAGDIAWTIVDQSTSADLNNVAGTFNGLEFTGAEDGAYNTTVTADLVCNTELEPLVLTVFVGSKQIALHDFEYVTGEENKDAPNYVSTFNLPTYSYTWLQYDEATGRPANAGYPSRKDLAIALNEQGIPFYMWPNKAVGDATNTSATATIVSAADGEPVRFGEHSLRIEFDFSNFNKASNANFYLRETTTPMYRYEGSPTAIGVWVYAPEGTTAYHLYLQCAGKVDLEAGTNVTSYQCLTTPEAMGNDSKGISWTGWKYLEFDLTGTKGNTGVSNVGGAYEPYGQQTDNGIFWISYQPSNMGTDVTSDTIYIDDITLIYGANTSDTHNPEINYIGDLTEQIVDGETVYTSNKNTFKAQYADHEDKYMTGIKDEATKMYIDGVDVTDKCYIDAGNDEIYFYDAVLPDGEHVIEIEVSDVFGNKTTEMRYFTIDSGAEDTEVSFVAANTPVLGEHFILDIVTNNAAEIAAADIEVKVLSFFTSYWRDVEVVPAPGFKLDGEAVYNSIKDTLSFRIVKDEVAAVAEGQDKIASIITKVPADTPENLEVTHRISKGAITYLSGATDTVAAFSGKLVSTCEAPLVISTDTMLVGTAGGNIYVKDIEGNAVEGAEVYTGETLLGTTDAEGKFFTEAFVDAVKEFTLTASKQVEVTPADPENGVEAVYKTLHSFTFKSQSYESKGDVTGLPSYIKLNAAETPWNSQSVSWMSNPLFTEAKAIVRYAEKAAYEANGAETVFSEFEGVSFLAELNSTGVAVTNYAIRMNSAEITGLNENTEYVFMVGDGTIWSEIKTFTTGKDNTATDFFIFADIQTTTTDDVDIVNAELGNTGIDFDFGLHTGDIVDNAGNYAYWEAAGTAFSTGVLGSTDIFHVLGNHEYTGDYYAANATHYYDLPGSHDTAPEAYSVEVGNIYIASFGFLGMSGYKSAIEWLKEDIAGSDATWKVLTVHQPPYYTNPGGATKGYRELITAAADELDIDFVFSGHDHAFARTQPITAGVPDAENGTVYYVCGSVGGKGYDLINEPAHYYAASMDYKDYNAVYMLARATDTEFTVEAYASTPDAKEVFSLIDSYTATKTVDCTEDGHDWILDNGWLTCSVCGFTKEVADYTGLAKDPETGRLMKLVDGTPVTGWAELEDGIYYFDENGVAASGDTQVGEYTYPLDENGKLKKFAFLLEDGTLATNRWVGNQYLGNDGLPVTGEYSVTEEVRLDIRDNAPTKVLTLKYTFDENGNLIKGAFNKNGNYNFYYLAGQPQRGWHYVDGYWYYCDRQNGGGIATLAHDGKTTVDTVKDGMYPVESSDGTSLLFTFDNNGRLVKGAWQITDNGTVFYWANNERYTGWHYIDSAIYYFSPVDFYAVTGEQVIGDKEYTFTEDGKLALTEENFELEGKYYYFDATSKIVTAHITEHPYTKEVLAAVEAKCEETGLTEGQKCSVCDYVLVAQETVDATGHTEEVLEAVAPTCTETGLTEGKKCSVCDEILVPQETVDALGHDYVAVTTEPTCTEDGKTVYTCSVCGDSYAETIAATGHTAGEWEVVTPADFGVAGLEQVKCTVCDAVIDSRVIDALEEPSSEDESIFEEPSSEDPTTEEPTSEEPSSEDPTEPPVEYMLGDVNRDGKITAADARLALRISAKLDIPDSITFVIADVNKDGEITAVDARKILRVSARIDTF